MNSYQRAVAILKGPAKLLYGIECIGQENIPAEGPFLLCANHTAALDPIILCYAVRRDIHFMVKEEAMKTPVLGAFLKSIGSFPVARGKADVHSLKLALSYLRKGDVVGIFPQGKRYPGIDPRTTEPKEGVGMIACRAKVPVLPVYIETKTNKVKMFNKTRAIIGKPIRYEDFDFEDKTVCKYKRASALIFDKICELGEGDLAIWK